MEDFLRPWYCCKSGIGWGDIRSIGITGIGKAIIGATATGR